jgi:hypothetical protein
MSMYMMLLSRATPEYEHFVKIPEQIRKIKPIGIKMVLTRFVFS